jgi:DNA-binding GntR family transcriptional regulator
MEPIKNKIHHFRIISIFTPNRLEGSLKEHKEILNALINKDDELAQKLMAHHIQEVGLIIEKKLKEKEDIK